MKTVSYKNKQILFNVPTHQMYTIAVMRNGDSVV